MHEKGGGPAYPTHPNPQPLEGEYPPRYSAGMTLRDWFAGQALAGFGANTELTDRGYEEMADYAYTQADAMLARREEQ